MTESAVGARLTPAVLGGEDHLIPETRILLRKPPEERIAFLRKRLGAKVHKDKPLGIWIPYERSKLGVKKLREMYLLAADGLTDLGLAIYGPTGVGKSMLIRKLVDDLTREGICKGGDIVWMDIRETAGEKRLLKAILRELRVDFSSHDDTDTLLDRVLNALKDQEVKMLVFDEIHNLLTGETYTQETLNAIKYLWNNSTTAIVLVGTERVKDLIEKEDKDKEMDGRFLQFELHGWIGSGDPNYLEFLTLAETRIPLPNPSHLASKRIADMLFEWSRGTARRLLWLIRETAIEAIESNSHQMSETHFQSVLGRYQLLSHDQRKVGNQK